MDKQFLAELLNKHRKGDLTKEERQFLISYYNLFQNEPDITDILSADRKNEIKSEIKEHIRNNISNDEQPFRKAGFINGRSIKVAAAAAIFMGFSISLFFLFNGLAEKDVPSEMNVKKSGGSSAKQVDTSALVQHKENRVLFLPDGSTVTLSPGSRLNYPSSFDGMKNREVFLYGQAFFDIKHNVSRPFIVHTGKVETIVLGTSFNIKAIPNETDITVTVKRGKVKVIDQNKTLGVITPNQQITYDLTKISSTVKVLDNDSYLDWKEQDLLLDNLTIGEAAKLLEERYRVKIFISGQSLGSQRFTTTFKKDASFEQVLKSICVFNGVIYKYNADKTRVVISNKPGDLN